MTWEDAFGIVHWAIWKDRHSDYEWTEWCTRKGVFTRHMNTGARLRPYHKCAVTCLWCVAGCRR